LNQEQLFVFMPMKTKILIFALGVLSLISACQKPPSQNSNNTTHDSKYPAVWFAPINDLNKPAWEILPQEAQAGEVILSKRNELGLLSNFAATPFEYRGKRYASLEGFWQMMLYPEGPKDPRAKGDWKYTRDEVAQMTGFKAKAAGTLAEENMKTMGIGWVSFESNRFPYRPSEPGEHYRLIVEATRAKVEQNPEVKRVLLATGDLILKPDHHEEPNAPEAWHYYKILTQIRSELRQWPDRFRTPALTPELLTAADDPSALQ
jgi:predicted NAD-dependent protein-ADP-ribosyltransferase YbiA (DUF1768 family)